jgi:hypothetical protein
MEDLEGSSSGGSTMGYSDDNKYSTKSSSMHSDPYADMLLNFYKKSGLQNNDVLKYAILASPIVIILMFSIVVSNSISVLICFTSWIFSLLFMAVGVWMLCEILCKDEGPRAMQDIAVVIREGSEGFFVT